MAMYGGAWVLRSENKVKVFVYNIFRNTLLLLYALMIACMAAALPVVIHQTDQFVLTFTFTFIDSMNLGQTLLLLNTVSNIETLQLDIAGCSRYLQSQEDTNLFNRKSNFLIHISKFLTVYFSIAVLIFFSPRLSLDEANWLPFPAKFPFDFYYIAFLWEFWHMVYTCIIFLTSDLSFWGLALQIYAQYELLERKLQTLKSLLPREDCRGERWEEVKNCVKLHQTIRRQVSMFNAIYNIFILVQFVCVVISICIFGSNLIVSMNSPTLAVSIMLVEVGLLLDLFIYCRFATMFQIMSEAIVMAAYDTSWLDGDKRLKQSMYMMIMAAQHPPKLTIGKIKELDMVAFLTVLNSLYTFFAVANHMRGT